ncbi:MAG: diaminopimelate epimerase [Candidatus Liberibacter ctenarytainae]|uniref:Diaminopimelate epimerase n=1 Tax=Candidatus Liberibacter ctenarytainae TaxID=2020335 RepID=A0A937ARC6_9HYPH|nr:diaminopimelate epimerase [Candidatus Liberibacter ctenarytainae]
MLASMVDFAKMEGIGNQILVVDMRNRSDMITLQAINFLSSVEDTRFDQIMSIHDSKSQSIDALIRIINRDGSEAQSCGNGMRCIVQFLSSKTRKKSFTFETLRGFVQAQENKDLSISIDMGEPIFDWKKIPLSQPSESINLHIGPINNVFLRSPSIISMGNPHAIFFVEDDIYQYDLVGFGKLLESHNIFPEGFNLSIAKVSSLSSVHLRTLERGVGLTAACGSAACASVVASVCSGRTKRAASVSMPGGKLFIEWGNNGHVLMTGTAEKKWDGKLDVQTGEWIQV